MLCRRLILLTALLSLGAGHAGAAAAPRPNVILMMADDLGWGDVGYRGHPDLKTPHLDALAAAGLRLDRFYAAAPVCSPTRGSCLTGRHPYRYGIFSANVGHLPQAEVTLAELLRREGYATGHFGKWHLGTLTKTEPDANRGGPRGADHYAPPDEHGFDVYFSTESKVPTFDPLWKPVNAGRQWWDPIADRRQAESYGTAYWSAGGRVTENTDGDDSRVILDRAIPFIRDAVRASQPFFAVIWFHAPHLPVVAGPAHQAAHAQRPGYQRNYFGCIAALDEQVGRLRAELRQLETADNTLLFFCSDNGPEGRAGSAPGTAGHLRGRKRDLFEGGIRVPAVVEWPGRIAPGVSRVPCCTSDYLPTVRELLNLPHDDRPLDGISLAPLFRGEMAERPRPIAFESAGQVALIDNRFKALHRPGGRRDRRPSEGELRLMLFDLIADESETTDVAAEHPDVVKRMGEQLAQWRAECRASRAGQDYADRAP